MAEGSNSGVCFGHGHTGCTIEPERRLQLRMRLGDVIGNCSTQTVTNDYSGVQFEHLIERLLVTASRLKCIAKRDREVGSYVC